MKKLSIILIILIATFSSLTLLLNKTIQVHASSDYPHYVSGSANSQSFICLVNDGTYQDVTITFDQALVSSSNPRYNQSSTPFPPADTFSVTSPVDFRNDGSTVWSTLNSFTAPVEVGGLNGSQQLTPGYYSMWFNWNSSGIAAPFQVVTNLSQCSNPLTSPTPTPTPSLVTAINAGGDTQGNFIADTDSSGGSQYSTSSSVDTGNVVNPAPEAVYQSVRYGNSFGYTIPNLTANASYTVRLHFNELYWGSGLSGNSGGEGSRVFNVAINNSTVLTNFDIFSTAGGANKALVEQFPVTADANGNIAIQFTTVTDNAMVNGIEVYSGTLPPLPTPTPVSSLAISAGGSGSGSYVTDTDYLGGGTYFSSASVDTSGVTNPAPEAVYQNSRYGNFTYTIPTFNPNAAYQVRLHFNEPYWGTILSGNNGGAGSRVFNVSVNGTQVLNNFDVYQTAGGANKAVVEQFNTTSDSVGFITIHFDTVADNALVSGIEISQL